jgi:hypothetical protein
MLDTDCVNSIRFSFDRAWDMAFLIDGQSISQDVKNKLDRVKETMWNRFVDDANVDLEKFIELERGSVREARAEGYGDGIDAAIEQLRTLRRES